MRRKMVSPQEVLTAIKGLSLDEKLRLKVELDALVLQELREELGEKLKLSWNANRRFGQSEIEEDVREAIRAYRSREK